MMMPDEEPHEKMQEAARRAAKRDEAARNERGPSFAALLGQIGVLGWAIVTPTLVGLLIGHFVDRAFGTGIFFSAPLVMLGAAAGLWTAWRWMHRQ